MSNMPCAPQCLQRTLAAAMVLAAAASATCDGARAEYPERQITMIVCFPAGGGTDIAARLINTSLGEALGKP
ncbi:MAG: tripartite tricarboxylate transporter substrate binding protein, partial [Alphaproteobacteria bacterium]